MALTQLGLEMGWWPREATELQELEGDWTFNHMDLLGYEGVGQVAEDDELRDLAWSVPSWVPNFALHAKIYTPNILSWPRTAEARIFPDDAPLPRIEDRSLFIPALHLDKLTTVRKVKDIKAELSLF